MQQTDSSSLLASSGVLTRREKDKEVALAIQEQISQSELPKSHLRLVCKQWLDQFLAYALGTEVRRNA